MGNTSQRSHRKKIGDNKLIKENEVVDDEDGDHLSATEEQIRHLPLELVFAILEHVPPVVIVRCQSLSKYWKGVFKSNGVWQHMCKLYGMHSIYFNDDTDYFSLFLSRFAVCFIDTKKISYYEMAIQSDKVYTPVKSVPTIKIPGSPLVCVGQYYYDVYNDMEAVDSRLPIYERWFKDQPVHPNLTVQKIHYNKEIQQVLSLFELTDDVLYNILIARPEMVTEANVSDIIRQILMAAQWLADRQIFSYFFNLENIRANVLPNNKIEIKIQSAVLDFSGVRKPDQIPPEVLCVEPITNKSYSWMIGWIAFMLLTGRDPFDHEYKPEHFEAIITARYEFADPADNHVTPSARDFISKLLKQDQSDRMSINEALNHGWIRSSNKSTKPMLKVIEGYKTKYNQQI